MTLLTIAIIAAFGGACCIAAPRLADGIHDDPLHWIDAERREDQTVAWTMLGIAALIVAVILLGINAIYLV